MNSRRLSAASGFLLVILTTSCSEAKLPFGLHGWVTDNTVRHVTGFYAFRCWLLDQHASFTCQYAREPCEPGLPLAQSEASNTHADCTSCSDVVFRGHHLKDRHANRVNDSSVLVEEVVLTAETGTAGKIYPPRLVEEIRREKQEVS